MRDQTFARYCCPVLGVSFASAASHIAALVKLKVIEKTKAHKVRVTAAEYRFVGSVAGAG